MTQAELSDLLQRVAEALSARNQNAEDTLALVTELEDAAKELKDAAK